MKQVFKEMLRDIAKKESLPEQVLASALNEASAVDAIGVINDHVSPVMKTGYRMIAEECDRSEDWENSRNWGKWDRLHPRIELNFNTLEMILHEGKYPIDLERFTHPAEILDTWLQVSHKMWCDEKLCFEFFCALEHACQMVFNMNAQGVFCPGGREMKIDWKKRTTKPSK